VINHTVFGAMPNTQDPMEHLSELRAIVCFPVNHICSGFWQKSPELAALAACKALHARAGRDRFAAWSVSSGASCNVPGQ
jgi:hypothetical protein